MMKCFFNENKNSLEDQEKYTSDIFDNFKNQLNAFKQLFDNSENAVKASTSHAPDEKTAFLNNEAYLTAEIYEKLQWITLDFGELSLWF